MHDTPQPRRPHDLDASEEALAARFAALERHDAPSAVRTALGRARAPRAASLLRLVRLDGWPLGGWGLASAALLLLALGAAAFVELSDPIRMPPADTAHAGAFRDLTIMEDSRLALFHAVETFDDVGLAPGHVIADWGR